MKNKNKKIWITIIIVALVVLGLFFVLSKIGMPGAADDIKKHVPVDVGYGLEVTAIDGYSGPYMEDASDEPVTDVMMIQVKNTGDKAIQYAEITLSGAREKDAVFKLSTLKKGETVTVLESTKKQYKEKDKYTEITAVNVAYFQNKPKTYADELKIQPLDGGLNVTNVSGKDIDEEIIIYFKDCSGAMLMGGITYRGRIEGGIKAGEICQLMSDNFTETNTKVVFITIGGK